MSRPKASSKTSTPTTSDVVVIGGGVMGTACAWKLAERGLSVVVLEKSIPGAEASTAAAGILGAHAEAHGPGPMADLLLAGLDRHAAWSDALAGATGIDVEFRKSGVLRLARDARGVKRLAREASWMRA
ncbi:MAG TPA: FAD-dependent oxidoreductase, partial [Polyangiaceae bacterium]|nr:FAD-dependent oxidoreductase [Polyangiaceae bacterium]